MSFEFLVDQWDAEEWEKAASAFPCHNIYQTWHYGELHSQGAFRSASRAILSKNGKPAVMAQFRIKRIPLSGKGVAEVDRGPLFDFLNKDSLKEDLVEFLRFVREEYSARRNLEIRISPRSALCSDKDNEILEIFESKGFKRNPAVRAYQTFILDLRIGLDEIRKNLHQKWRNQLAVAEKSGLTLQWGTRPKYFDRFLEVYYEMWANKRFPTGVRVPIIRRVQEVLPENLKFLVTIAVDHGQDIGATVCSLIGDTCLYFLGASKPLARKETRPGYLLQWFNISQAKESGRQWYDIGGYNELESPELTRFKVRMSGQNCVYPGRFELESESGPAMLISFGESLYRKSRRLFTGR